MSVTDSPDSNDSTCYSKEETCERKQRRYLRGENNVLEERDRKTEF